MNVFVHIQCVGFLIVWDKLKLVAALLCFLRVKPKTQFQKWLYYNIEFYFMEKSKFWARLGLLKLG